MIGLDDGVFFREVEFDFGIVFICQVEDEEPVPEQGAVQDIVWMKRSELRRILDTSPERIFTLQLPVLDYYLSHHCE